MNMKRFLLCLISLLLVLSLCGCASVTHNDLSKYAKWDRFTYNTLNSEFSGTLPSKELVKKYGKEYYYKFEEALLGDPNFVILVKLEIPDADALEKQLSFLRENSEKTIYSDGRTYYFMRSVVYDTAVSEYLDDKIYDGMFYRFEIVSADENGTVSFLSAYVWDYWKDEVLIDFFQPIVKP